MFFKLFLILFSALELRADPARFQETVPFRCKALIHAASRHRFDWSSPLLPNIEEFRRGLLAEVDERGHFVGKLGNEFELGMGVMYGRFLHQRHGSLFLLFPAFDDAYVPTFDGVVFERDGAPRVNVSFKTLQTSKNPRGRVFAALNDLKWAYEFDADKWAKVLDAPQDNIPRRLLSPSLKMSEKIYFDFLSMLTSHYKKRGGRQVHERMGNWLRLHKFFRIFGIGQNRKSNLVVALQNGIEFPRQETIREIKYYLHLNASSIEEVVFLRENIVLQITAKGFEFHRIR